MNDAASHRVVMVLQGDEIYGVGTTALGLGGTLVRRGHAVRFLCERDGPLTQAAEGLGIEVSLIKVGTPPAFGGGTLDRIRAVAASRRYAKAYVAAALPELQKWNPTAVHVHWPHLLSVAGRMAQALNAPAFWEMPNIVTPRPPLHLARRYYQRSCKHFGITPLANSAFTAATLGQRPLKARVFHLGVDAERFDPRKVEPMSRSEFGLSDTTVIFGIVARLDSTKGQVRFAEALLRHAARGVDVGLLLVGGPPDGPDAMAIRKLLDRPGLRGLPNRVVFAGLHDRTERFYAMMDVNVNARIDPEPFGLSVVEGLMMGRPTLVHALGGPAETVEDGVTGWHVNAPTVEAFEAAIHRVLADRKSWARMGSAAEARARTDFSTESVADRYLALL